MRLKRGPPPASAVAQHLADLIKCEVTERDGIFYVGKYFTLRDGIADRHITIICTDVKPPMRMTRARARAYARVVRWLK